MSVQVYSSGLIHCSVCAPAAITREQVEAALNRSDPVLAEAFERIAAQITKARLKAGGSRRKRKGGAEGASK